METQRTEYVVTKDADRDQTLVICIVRDTQTNNVVFSEVVASCHNSRRAHDIAELMQREVDAAEVG